MRHLSPSPGCITNYPKTWWLQTINLYYLMVSVSQEFESGLLAGSGLGSLTSWQSRCWPRLQSSEDLTGAERSASKMAPSHGYWQEVSVPPHMDLFIRPLEHPHGMVAGLPQSKGSKRQKGKIYTAFYSPASKFTHHHFCYFLFARNELLGPDHTQRERN